MAAQEHWTSEGSKLALDRVLGVAQAAPAAASATTFADLHASIDSAISYLQAIDPAALEAGLDGAIELPVRGRTKSFRGDRFLIEFALPNFFFHLTLAYAILRKEGVPLLRCGTLRIERTSDARAPEAWTSQGGRNVVPCCRPISCISLKVSFLTGSPGDDPTARKKFTRLGGVTTQTRCTGSPVFWTACQVPCGT